MRVAFLGLHFAEYSAHLCLALADVHDVLLFLYEDNARNELGDRLKTEFVHPRLQIVQLARPKGLLRVLGNARAIVSQVARFAPDVVHMQEELRDELILALPLIRRHPLIMTIHDPVNHSGQDAKRLRFSRFRLYRAIVRRSADRVIAHGQAMTDAVEACLPRLRGRVDSVPHGPLGPTGDLPPPVLPKEHSFLFFGRIHEYKGLRYFIEAVQQLHRSGVPVRGVIAGRGPDLKANRLLLAQTPSAFVVDERYIDEAEVRRLFSETTAAVIPYVDGTQSGVAAMAIGSGRPIIATKVGSIPEMVRDGVNGILVSPRSVDELVAAMSVFLVDDARWAHLAGGARTLRSGELSWREIAKATTRIYMALDIRKQKPLH